MNPIIQFLSNLYFQSNSSKNIDEFFNDGISFPDVIMTVFGNRNLPIKRKPNNEFDINNNNSMAIQCLASNFPDLIDSKKTYFSTEERTELLTTFIREIFFKIDERQIFETCQDIFKYYNININNEKELLTEKNVQKLYTLLSLYYSNQPNQNLLNIPKPDDESFNNFLYTELYGRCPICIDSSFFNGKYNYLIYVQIFFIF